MTSFNKTNSVGNNRKHRLISKKSAQHRKKSKLVDYEPEILFQGLRMF